MLTGKKSTKIWWIIVRNINVVKQSLNIIVVFAQNTVFWWCAYIYINMVHQRIWHISHKICTTEMYTYIVYITGIRKCGLTKLTQLLDRLQSFDVTQFQWLQKTTNAETCADNIYGIQVMIQEMGVLPITYCLLGGTRNWSMCVNNI